MTYKIVTQEGRTFNAENVVDDVAAGFSSEYIYYVFLAKHTQYNAGNDVPVIPEDDEAYKRQVYNDMLFGKRVTANDAKVMINRYDYVSDTVYDRFDDQDEDIMSKKFYVTVSRGNEHDVFKCLDNRGGIPSTQPPDKTDTNAFDEIYRTSDGYIWKYMYTIPYADMEKFATESYVPVIANTSVATNAKNGAIDVVVVESPGKRYDNYLEGTIGLNDLNISGDIKKINLAGNNVSSTIDDFYQGCIFKIVSGTGIGAYSRIQSYDAYSNFRVITLSDALNIDTTSEYEIMPEVRIVGDYTQTINAYARAVVNTTSNTISYVEVLNRGLNYKKANAYVFSSSVVPIPSGGNSVVRPILGPYGGHGYDANNELGAARVCFSVTFNESVDSLPTLNDFRQVGVMTNPRFSNVVVNFSSKDSTTFISGETLYQVNPVRIYGSGFTISTSANSITATTAQFDELATNTILYVVGSSSKQLATVVGVSNSTVLTIDSPGSFACNDCEVYLANVSGPAKVVNDIAMAVAIEDVYVPFTSGVRLVGYDSGASGVVSNMKMANTATLFNTFNQMWKYYVNTSDTFDDDEVVYQPASAANSQGNFFGLKTIGSDTVMYLTNQFGYINTGDSVTGANSGDSAYVASSYEPDLVYNSGRIIYLENIEKVARTNGQKETFKIIFSY